MINGGKHEIGERVAHNGSGVKLAIRYSIVSSEILSYAEARCRQCEKNISTSVHDNEKTPSKSWDLHEVYFPNIYTASSMCK